MAQDVISRIAREETSGIKTGENYAKMVSNSEISEPYYQVTGESKSRTQLLNNLIFVSKKIDQDWEMLSYDRQTIQWIVLDTGLQYLAFELDYTRRAWVARSAYSNVQGPKSDSIRTGPIFWTT